MKNTQHSSFLKLFMRGEAISAFWNFTTKGVGLFNTFLIISSLSLYEYGVFQLLLSIAGISSDTLSIGGGIFSNEMSHKIAEKKEDEAKKIFFEYSVVRILIAVILWAVVYFGATILFEAYTIEFIKDLRIISFLFITEALFLIIKTLSVVKLEFALNGIRTTISRVIQSCILIYFFIQGNLGLKQLIWSIVIASVLSLILILPMFYKIYRQWRSVKTNEKSLLWNIITLYGGWDIVRQLGNRITFRIKPWLIKLFVSTEAVAIYSIAEMMVSTLQDILPSKTLQSLVPLWIQDKKISAKMFSYGIKYFVIAGIVLVLGALIFVPPIVHIFFEKYEASLSLFYFMLLNLPIFAAGIIIGNYIIAFRKQKFLFVHNTFRNVLAFVIIFSTLPFIGLWGLAIEFVVVPFVMVLFSYYYSKKRNPGFYFNKDIIFSFREEDKEILRKIIAILHGWFRKGIERITS